VSARSLRRARSRRIGWLLMGLAAAGCSAGPPAPPVEAPRPPPAPLVVSRGELEDRMVLTGELEATTSENLIVPRTPNWTLQISWIADEGALVKKGDRVVEFDTAALSNTLEEKRISVQRAESELQSEQARASGTLADKTIAIERDRADLQKAAIEADVPPDLVARRDYQQKQLTLAQQRDTLAHAEQDLRVQQQTSALDIRIRQVALDRARRDYENLNRQLEELTLRAPRDGLVQLGYNQWENRKFLAGDQAIPPWVVASLPELGGMQVRAKLSDVDDGTVREGMAAECVLDAYPGRVWKGSIDKINPLARPDGKNATRRFFEVVVTLQQAAPDLMRPGMSVRVEVIRRRAAQALLVPRQALSGWPGSQRLRLASGATTQVEVEFCTEFACAVRGGVVEGTRLQPARQEAP
jgi:multidrug resistance efflux pump